MTNMVKVRIPTSHFVTVPKTLEDVKQLETIPIIIESDYGEFFAAEPYDVGEGEITVENCHELRTSRVSGFRRYSEKRWVESPGMGRTFFFNRGLKSIYRAKDPDLQLDDVMNLVLNPKHEVAMGIGCDYECTGKHSSRCDNDLHEALSKLRFGIKLRRETGEETKQLNAEFSKIRRFIIKNGGRIP